MSSTSEGRVSEICGCSQTEAKHLLTICNDNEEAAIALFFGADVDVVPTTQSNLPDVALTNVEENEVRAPIAPIREQIIGPQDDNFVTSGTQRLARMTQRVKVCPLRDFAREGAIMEEEFRQEAAALAAALPQHMLAASSSNSIESSCLRRRERLNSRSTQIINTTQMINPPQIIGTAVEIHGKVVNTTEKSSRLGDLFRPPTDIAYVGTFQTARERATALKHWLLVNVQSLNFDSQLLNRDVWSDKEVRKVLRRQFLLWQVDSDSSEGRRFTTFYHCTDLPYVCIIDPRTGEEVWKNSTSKQTNLLQDLRKFLRTHKDFSLTMDNEDSPSTSKRIIIESLSPEAEADISITSSSGIKRKKLIELSEEEQIALAIQNSIRESGLNSNSNSSSTNGDDDKNDIGDDENVNFEADDCTQDTKKSYHEASQTTNHNAQTVNNVKNQAEQENRSDENGINSYERMLGENKDELTMLKVRLVNVEGADEVIELRWPSDTKLKVLRLYLTENHRHILKHGYKLISAFPRRSLDTSQDECTLKELGLHPSTNLHVLEE